MSLLGRPLQLHNVRDVEAMCIGVIQQSGLELSFHDNEDLLAFLIASSWEISRKHVAGDPPHFRPLLRRRVVDWQRARFGRTRWQFKDKVYERPRPVLVSLNADDPGGSRLGESLPAVDGDPATDSSTDLERVLGDRSSTRARDFAEMGLGLPGGSAKRARKQLSA